jgi:membrane fusion protein (multidrug efflux system)
MKQQRTSLQQKFRSYKADIGSILASISVSEANVKSAGGNIETAKIRLDRVSNDYNRYNNLYKSHTITKQQYEQALAKLEAENQVRILQQQEKTAFQNLLLWLNQKQLTSRLM